MVDRVSSRSKRKPTQFRGTLCESLYSTLKKSFQPYYIHVVANYCIAQSAQSKTVIPSNHNNLWAACVDCEHVVIACTWLVPFFASDEVVVDAKAYAVLCN